MSDAADGAAGEVAADMLGTGKLALLRVPMVLMYHSIADDADDLHNLCVTPTRFAEQMAWLKRHGLRGVGVGTLLDAMRAGRHRRLVGITFDDGYVNALEAAVPELLRQGFTATMFIISGMLGGTNEWDEGAVWPLMSADQVRALAAAGMEVGSHSVTHVPLTSVRPDRLQAEVTESKATLGELTGSPIRGFAYPYGSISDAARRVVRGAGYEYGCAVLPPVADFGPMSLPRVFTEQSDGPLRMTAKRLLLRPLLAVKGGHT